jgi:hypothetical protein
VVFNTDFPTHLVRGKRFYSPYSALTGCFTRMLVCYVDCSTKGIRLHFRSNEVHATHAALAEGLQPSQIYLCLPFMP